MVRGVRSCWAACSALTAWPGNLAPLRQSMWMASIAAKLMCSVRSTGVPVGLRMPTTVNGLSSWSLASNAPSPWLSTTFWPSR